MGLGAAPHLCLKTGRQLGERCVQEKQRKGWEATKGHEDGAEMNATEAKKIIQRIN